MFCKQFLPQNAIAPRFLLKDVDLGKCLVARSHMNVKPRAGMAVLRMVEDIDYIFSSEIDNIYPTMT